MKSIFYYVTISLFFLFPGFSYACDTKACDLREFASPSEMSELKEYLRNFRKDKERSRNVATLGSPRAPSNAMAKAAKPTKTVDKTFDPNAVPPPSTSFTFFLRKDFEDVGLFSSPAKNADASGAEFTYSRDNIKMDTTWAGTGLVAVAYNYTVEDIYNPFIGWTIAPYLSWNREIHSSKAADNIDSKTFGLSAEIGWRNALFPNRADYIRGSFAAVRDDILDYTRPSAKVEWLPTYAWIAGTIPGSLIVFNFTPEVIAQFDTAASVKKPLMFSGQQEALRVGPEAVLWLSVYDPAGILPDFMKRVTANVTYHWWTETYSGRNDSWLDTSLSYRLDEAGMVGLKFSYKRGREETTGTLTDLYKISLSAKLCADVFSTRTCS